MYRCYPLVLRLSFVLTGRPAAGRSLARLVLRRAMRHLATWGNEDEPERWFFHHTVLASRQVRVKRRPRGFDDVLIFSLNEASTEYIAFIRAIRALPVQQREAFLLSYAEKGDTRRLAVAMDCSTTAAVTHLNAARTAIKAVAGERFEALVGEMQRVYATLNPDERIVIPQVNTIVRRYIWPRRIARTIGWIVTLAVLGSMAWAAWWVYHKVEI
jgi:DNA-directed RNA polymerase specialized sigma24 family protein